MLFQYTLALTALSLTASAAPINKRWWHGLFWSNPSNHAVATFHNRMTSASDMGSFCDLSQASLPPIDPSLPLPAGSLYTVVIGRGTQNYTCDKSNATAIPSPTGANATLFNVSCIAASMPDLLAVLPDIALNLPIPTSDSSTPDIMDEFMVGHHYFADLKTPLFNLTTEKVDYGMGTFAKVNATPAPEGAMVGVNGQGHGAVAWLKLDTQESEYVEEQQFKSVYRMNTAGGSPPEDCTESPEAFEVQYAAEYWFYS